MSSHSRRDFLKRSAAVAGGVAAFTFAGAHVSARAKGANDRIRVAVVGINGRGRSHIDAYRKMKGVEIAYLVDADSRLFASSTRTAERAGLPKPKCAQDLRKVLDDKSLDAVSIATTNSSHALLAVWACQAGKDVYVEKPCSHNIFEGRKIVEAARKYDRIVQIGTQSRSDAFWLEQVKAVQSGKYGKLLISYGYASKMRPSIGFKLPANPPKELDFDIWLGPALEQKYHENIVHYNWHWFWDFGNGEIGNQGIHQLDIARWAMPIGAEPQSVISLGGRFGYEDQGQTPNTQFTVIDFGGPKMFFEDRGLVVNGKTSKVDNEFYTDQGVIKDGKFFPKGSTAGEPIVRSKAINVEFEPNHFANFIAAVRSHKREMLHAEILEGHRSSLLAHLANTSYRLGTQVPFDKELKEFRNDKAAYDSFQDMKEHLKKVTKMDLKASTYCLGRSLKFDAKAERYVDDDEANKLLTRPYRKPYVVPEQV